MKNTWILCMRPDGGRLFQTNDARDGVRFLWQIPCEREENCLSTLASRMNEAYHQDIFDYLILCGEEPYLSEIQDELEPEVCDRVIGTVEQDLYWVNESDLIEYVQDYLIRDEPRAA